MQFLVSQTSLPRSKQAPKNKWKKWLFCFRCVCRSGFEGDGHSCTPVNLCLKPVRGGCDSNVGVHTLSPLHLWDDIKWCIENKCLIEILITPTVSIGLKQHCCLGLSQLPDRVTEWICIWASPVYWIGKNMSKHINTSWMSSEVNFKCHFTTQVKY